ncbi:hypothetical protein NDU88_002361 [Pleurodeles waltl]|uniref:Uncharacterized protein n=1 Tax=Pleurodeles waltl TaxID=8319 RepID=A0AAV7MVG7_PLEWA|nr:hypothetical protein NDU88_002361 [Pleurodeles waltl]
MFAAHSPTSGRHHLGLHCPPPGILCILSLAARGAPPKYADGSSPEPGESSHKLQRLPERPLLGDLSSFGPLPGPFKSPGEPRDSAVTPPLQRHYSSARCRPRRDPVAEWPPGAASLAVTYLRERPRASTSARPLYTPVSSSLCHAPSAFVAGLHVRPFAPLSAHAGAATRRPARVSLQLLLRSPHHSRAAENGPGVPLIRACQTRARQHRRIWQ